jgi:hypothetical protein
MKEGKRELTQRGRERNEQKEGKTLILRRRIEV